MKIAIRYVLFITGFVTLFGCSNKPDSEILAFVQETKKRESKLQELPEFKRQEPYFYGQAEDKRDPFFFKLSSNFRRSINTTQVAQDYTGPMPDLKRKKEVLEDYPLDKLSMVGVISKNGKYWALIKSGDGIIHRLSVGNYLGQNYGKIVEISDEQIKIDELIPDSQGGWIERRAIINIE